MRGMRTQSILLSVTIDIRQRILLSVSLFLVCDCFLAVCERVRACVRALCVIEIISCKIS